MPDSDVANLYRVPTRRLNEQVTRNSDRFPEDFMFQFDHEEADALRSQIATSKERRGNRGYLPSVFTEQGVAMLSSVLRGERAVQVKELARKLEAIEKKNRHASQGTSST